MGTSLPESVKLACSSGTAAAETVGTELYNKGDAEKILPHVDPTIMYIF